MPVLDLIEDVADAVGDVVGGVADAVGDVVEGAVDIVEDVVGAVGDAVDWVVDEVIEPVVSGIGDVIDYALDNPIEAIATLAVTVAAPYAAPFLGTTTAALTGAAQWVIPLASGTQTLVNGGSLEDAVKSAAISFAGTYAGKVAGTYINPTVENLTSKAISNTKLASTVSNVLGAGTKSAAKTFARTGDLKAAANAFAQASALGGVNAGLEAATDAVMGNIDQALQDSGFGKEFNNLASGVKDSIYTSVAAEITGQDVSAQTIIDALDSEGFVTDLIDKYVPVASFMDGLVEDAKTRLGENLSETQIQLLSDAVSSSWDAAKAGNPDLTGEAFFGSLQEEAYEQLIDTISDPIDSALDSLTGNADKAEAAAAPLNEAIQKTAEATSNHNALTKELNERVQEQERLKKVYNDAVAAHNANPSQETANAANIASTAFNNHALALNDDYPDIKAQLDAYKATYDKYEPTIEGLQEAYDEESKYLISDIEDLDSALKPMLTGVDKVIATTLRPGIDEASYRELNGLSADEDVYSHYISNIGIAQVFDVEALNEEAAEKGELYGEGYTYGYDEASGGSAYYLDTPDGKVKVDPYLEGIGGGRGGDPRDFNNGVWTMEQYRKQVADPITLGGRLTYDMASILGDSNKQGQLITLNDFKELKDAGYNVTPFKDRFTGETVNGNTSYDDILANYMQERARMGANYQKPKGYTPVDFMGYTEVTQDLHNDVIGFWKEQGLSDADARARAAETAPVGSILNENDRFSTNSSLQDLVNFRDYIDTLEVGDDYKYSFNENYDQIMIAEATRLGGDADPSTIEAFLRNTSGLGLDAIGQLAQTMSYATILTNAAGLTDTAAEDTWLARFGEVLSDTGEGIQTDEYRAKVTKLNEDMAKAMSETEGFWDTVGAIGTTAWNNPTAFVSEYIVSEIFQELPLLVASGGTATLLKGGLSVGAKAVGKEFAENTLKRSGVSAALATSLATNVAEGFGGAAQDGYEKGLNTYNKVTFENLRKQGLSVGEARAVLDSPDHVAKAEKYATDLAEMAGVIGGGVALITAGLASGTPLDNLALEKALFGDKKAPDGFINQLKDYASTVGKEGLAEGAEEGAISGFIEGRLSLIDPTRDVSGNNTAAALLGTISGAGTTGGILVGNEIVSSLSPSAATFVMTASPENLQKVGIGSFQGPTYTGAATDAPVVRPTLQQITAAAQEFGLDRDATDSLKNISYNSQIITKDEIQEYVQLTNPEFNFTDDTLEAAYTELGGEKATEVSNADLERLVNQFIDPLYMTREEAAKAGLAEGIVLTEEQIDEIVGDNNVTDETGEQDIIDRYDDLYTSRAEAEQFFAELGYTPTEEEITARVGATPDADQKEAIAAYVDPRQVTKSEAKKFFEDQGFSPSDSQVNRFVGQGDENFAADQETGVGDYVDPRQVTEEEARKFYTDLGYEPTDKEVAALVGQSSAATVEGDDVYERDIKALVPDIVDPRQVTEAEARKYFEDQGYTPTEEDIANYTGQGDENFQETTKAAATTYADPLATTQAEAKQFFEDQGFTPTDQQVADFVASKTEEEQKAAIAEFVDPRQVTTDEAKALFDALGYEATDEEVADFVGQGEADFAATTETGVGTYVDPRQVTAEEAREFFTDLGYDPTDEQVAQFVAQVEETTQSGLIASYVDPRQVTREEVQAIADEEGLTLTDALAATYVGQGVAENYASEKLSEARAEYDPLATTLEEATQFFADTGYTATPEEIAQFVASKTEETQTSAIGGYVDPRQVTAAEAEEFLSAIGYQPSQEDIDAFTGQVNDENYQTTQKAAIDEFVDPRFFDAGEVRAAYEELGLVDVTQEDVDRFVGQFDPESEDYDAAGFEAFQREQLTTYMPTATFNVIKSIMGSPSVEDNPNTPEDESKEATGIYKELEEGATRDEALQAAIDKLTEDLGLTEDAMLEQLGLTKEELSGEIDAVAEDVAEVKEDVAGIAGDVADVAEDVSDLAGIVGTPAVEDDPNTEADESQDPTGIFATIKAYEDAGMERDEALTEAIGEVATSLGLTEDALLEAIGETETSLSEKITGVETGLTEKIGEVEAGLTETIGDVETSLGADIDAVADLVGKPAREVTQTDIDFVIDLIAQENVSQELITQYDVTGDGIIDINDQTLLETALQGEEDVTLADTSMFTPATGIYGEIDTQTDTITDMITDLNTQINTKINTQTQQQNVNDLANMLMQADDIGGRRVDVKTPDALADITPYSFESIFRDQGQAQKFVSPYGTARVPTTRPANNPAGPLAFASGFAEGGQVEDENDMLLRILGDM